MANDPLPPIDFLRECVDYDPDTGLFVWRERPLKHFRKAWIGRSWNTRLAGTQAFHALSKGGYRRGEVVTLPTKRWRFGAHRAAYLLMTGETPELIDHINGITDDNRWGNLRNATPLDNSRNVRRAPRPYPPGVYLESGRYTARATVPGNRKVYLGRFDTSAEARAAYCAFTRPRHGEFFVEVD